MKIVKILIVLVLTGTLLATTYQPTIQKITSKFDLVAINSNFDKLERDQKRLIEERQYGHTTISATTQVVYLGVNYYCDTCYSISVTPDSVLASPLAARRTTDSSFTVYTASGQYTAFSWQTLGLVWR